jgi:hypothetical protein
MEKSRHFSPITTTANSKIVLVLGSPNGVEYEYEYRKG